MAAGNVFRSVSKLCSPVNIACLSLCLGGGSAGTGLPDQKADVTLSMSDEDLLAMFEGSLGPYAAYTSRRLKVQGELKTAMKLEGLIKLLRK